MEEVSTEETKRKGPATGYPLFLEPLKYFFSIKHVVTDCGLSFTVPKVGMKSIYSQIKFHPSLYSCLVWGKSKTPNHH